MIRVFRIARSSHIRDLSGEGARRYGGRWNRKGTGVVYAADSRALATVEYLVHVPLTLLPTDISIAEIEIPDNVEFERIELDELPSDWATHPPPSALAGIGESWISRGSTAVLRVPSAVVRGEWNVLINPAHPEAQKVRIALVEPIRFDERLRRA